MRARPPADRPPTALAALWLTLWLAAPAACSVETYDFTPDPVCGNGALELGEDCDDGKATTEACAYGLTSCTVCDAACRRVAGATAYCGDGELDAARERCDDGNALTERCAYGATSCTVCGTSCQPAPGVPARCGDGTTDGPFETCEDGNATDRDGCSACRLELLETEPNEDGSISTGGRDTAGNDFGTTRANANGAVAGSVVLRAALAPAGDEDVFLLANSSAQAVALQLDIWSAALGIGVSCGTSIDTALNLRTASGALIASNDDRNATSDYCSTLSYTLGPGARVYAHVLDYDDDQPIAGYLLVVAFRPMP
jgi:cysteine-rich repeat protein